MSKGVNMVVVLGNLGKEPESRTTPSGLTVTSFSLAVNERKKGESGEWEDAVEWFRVVSFGRTAEVARDYLRKGSQAHIVGRLSTRKYTDKSGVDRYVTEVIANDLTLLSSPDGASSAPKPAAATAPAQKSAPAGNPFEDDIPFAWAYLAPVGGVLASLVAYASTTPGLIA